MLKRVAILQSNYIPWKGYFDIIHDVDEFVFHDDLQYTKQDWRNRNRIKTASGLRWLTVPVGDDENRRICDVELPRNTWASEHWQSLEGAYRHAPHFQTYRPWLETVYRQTWTNLSHLNQHIIRTIAGLLGARATFRDSRDLGLRGRKQERVIEILRHVGAGAYISGPVARNYLEPERFAAEGIDLVWKSYDGYPEYPQLYPPFVHEVTILDLLFHTGPDAPRYIWGWRTETP
jgi:hypothetical protein